MNLHFRVTFKPIRGLWFTGSSGTALSCLVISVAVLVCVRLLMFNPARLLTKKDVSVSRYNVKSLLLSQGVFQVIMTYKGITI